MATYRSLGIETAEFATGYGIASVALQMFKDIHRHGDVEPLRRYMKYATTGMIVGTIIGAGSVALQHKYHFTQNRALQISASVTSAALVLAETRRIKAAFIVGSCIYGGLEIVHQALDRM